MQHAIGISVHTGWAACVVVAGSPRRPEVIANAVVELLGEEERFCFHRASTMKPDAVPAWLASVRAKALAEARKALEPLLAQVDFAAIVAKDGPSLDLKTVPATHMQLHGAEGSFYRDVFRETCRLLRRQISCHIVAPKSLDPATIGKLETKPWGKDQKLAALAAWQALGRHS
jgi:hypothetical protein